MGGSVAAVFLLARNLVVLQSLQLTIPHPTCCSSESHHEEQAVLLQPEWKLSQAAGDNWTSQGKREGSEERPREGEWKTSL